MIPTEVVNEILAKADIVQIISHYIPVIKKGNSYVAVCPFHDDHDPSMAISPSKQIFKCFVCHTGGNVFSFVANYEKITYVDAIRKVAELINFTHPSLEQNERVVPQETKDFLKALKDASQFYHYILTTQAGIKGKQYFAERNISQEMIDYFSLGFAPENGQATIKQLRAKGNEVSALDGAGILLHYDDSFSDRYRGRIIFPIHNQYGEIIGFSARKIGDVDGAKYINSPASAIFNKSEVLYNLHNAKNECKRAGYCYIVEGFMDVFSLYRVGIKSAVALMGTAFTNEHAKILKGLGVEMRLCLDGDDAGQHGIVSMIPLLEKNGVPYRIVNYKGDKRDPDDIYQQDGEDALKKLLGTGISKENFLINYFQKSCDVSTSDGKKDFVNKLTPFLNTRNEIELDIFINQISDVIKVSPGAIKKTILNKDNVLNKQDEIDIQYVNKNRVGSTKMQRLQRQLIFYMISSADAYDYIKNTSDVIFVEDIYLYLANYIEDLYLNKISFSVNDLISAIQENGGNQELISEVTEIAMNQKYPDFNEEIAKECLNAIKSSIKNKQRKEKISGSAYELDYQSRAMLLDQSRKE